MSSANESVTIVDASNQVIGAAPRWVMRRDRMRHRATFIFVFASNGELLIQRRTDCKDLYPGYYDLAAGGVVTAGEDYAESAQRETLEELGIKNTPLEEGRDFYYEAPDNRCFGRIYRCLHDGPFRLQPEEVAAAFFRPLDEVYANQWTPVTPDTLQALEILLRGTSKNQFR